VWISRKLIDENFQLVAPREDEDQEMLIDELLLPTTKTPHRVCAYMFTYEADLPPGKKLLTCSKCQDTHYKDRVSQKAHWKDHKLFCRSVKEDTAFINMKGRIEKEGNSVWGWRWRCLQRSRKSQR
jgi:hypothetical protein